MPLLDIQHLSKTFSVESGIFRQQVGSVHALSDVSFCINKGETLAVVGGSGCGKSTLAKLICGLFPADSGQMLWEGRDLSTFSRSDRAHRVQMIFQDPFASLNPKLSVGLQLCEMARNNSDPVALLAEVGLPADAMNHYPFQFSGGQRQRIAIARALAMKPSLLIADEPLSALDVTVQAQVLALLKSLKASLGLTILFITHDLAIAESFADRMLVLEEGKIVEEGTTAAVLSHPKHAYTRALIDAVPRIA